MTRIGLVFVRCFVLVTLVLGSVWLASTGTAAAQTDAYGPDAVFNPPDDFTRALFDCQGPTCVQDTMRAFGASESAIAFVTATDGGYLASLEEHGRVDLALVWFPTRANDNGQHAMVNGAPPLVMAETAWDVSLTSHPAYASLLAAYPQLTMWSSDNLFGGVEPTADGGQRFLFNYPLVNGCHACDLVGWAQVAFDFDATGNFLSMTLLGPPTEGTTAPPSPTALAAAVAPTTTTLPPAITAAPRQVAYHDAAGAIWLVDDSGANPRQIAAGERCCVSWSRDGQQLFYLRVPPGADDTTPRPIMVYDLATGQERLLGAATLAVSSLGTMAAGSQRLPFIHNRPATNAALIDNAACLADIDPQTGTVSELGCLDGAFLHEPVEMSDATGLVMGYGGFEIVAIIRYDYHSGFDLDFIGCCGAPSYFPDLSYASLASQYFLFDIWSYEPNTMGIFRWHSGSDTPEPLYLSTQALGSPDVSPEGDRLVFSEEDNVTIYDIARGETRIIGVGREPRWRPGQPPAAPTAAPAITPAPSPIAPATPATLNAAAGQPVPTATAAVVTEATAPADGAVANVEESGADGVTDAGEVAETTETEGSLATRVRTGWPWLVLALGALVIGVGASVVLITGRRRRSAPVVPLPPPAAPRARVAPGPVACPQCGQLRSRPARFCTHCGYRFPGDPNLE